MLDSEGRPVGDLCKFLAHAPWADSSAFKESPPSSPPEPPEAIAPVVEGCALISGLVRKAAERHHLRHTERLALLYTLGHMGEAGRAYLHQVIGLCDNYEPRTTERWLRRIEEGHRPLRCSTLREWLKDYLPEVSCTCEHRTSPLDLLRSQTQPTECPTEGWDEVAWDMFGDMLIEEE